MVPLQVGVLQFPIPTAKRCYELGQALRRAIESYPEDLSVAVVATGGLSHHIHGERCGFNNTEWDNEFLDLLEKRSRRALTRMTHAEYAEKGGVEGAEVIMWLIMRGALSDNIRCIHRDYCLPALTAIGTLIYENQADDGHRPRPRIAIMSTGSWQASRISRAPTRLHSKSATARSGSTICLHRLVVPEHRKRFLDDTRNLYDDFELTDEERRMLDQRDWLALIQYGVIFFCLEKMAAVLGISNP